MGGPVRTAESERGAALPRVAAVERVIEAAVEACRRFPLDEPDLARTDIACLCRSTLLKLAGAARAEYEDILVLSGRATAFAYHPIRPAQLEQPPDDPGAVEARISGATGFAWESLTYDGTSEDAWRAVRASLDEGRPLQARWTDDLIFCGYRDDTTPEGREVMVGGGWDAPTWWSWGRFDKWVAEFGVMGRVGSGVTVAPRHQTARASLEAMARAAEADPRGSATPGGSTGYGTAGIRAFARDLGDLALRPDHWGGCWISGYCVYRQVSGRAAAARFVRAAVADCAPAAAQSLLAAAESFERAAEAWAGWDAELGFGAARSGSVEPRSLWYSAGNRRQASFWVHRACEHETEAARQLELALRLIRS